MSDLFYEHLVKRQQTFTDKLIKYGIYTFTAIFFILGALSPIFFIGVLVFGLGIYFIVPKTNIEYEYLFVNGEIDIDTIFSKSKRKKATSFSVKNCEIVAPYKSHRLDSYKNIRNLKYYDFSSRTDDSKKYACITKEGGSTVCYLIEPDNGFINEMKKYSPSKVFLD